MALTTVILDLWYWRQKTDNHRGQISYLGGSVRARQSSCAVSSQSPSLVPPVSAARVCVRY